MDKDFSWERQARAAATKAHVAIRRIARAANCLPTRDRKLLVEALALPHLDGAQTALAAPSKAATQKLVVAYHKAARVAVWGLRAVRTRTTRTAPADNSKTPRAEPPTGNVA